MASQTVFFTSTRHERLSKYVSLFAGMEFPVSVGIGVVLGVVAERLNHSPLLLRCVKRRRIARPWRSLQQPLVYLD